MVQKKVGAIAFVVDERLSREKAQIITRHVNAMRQFAQIDVLNGGMTEEQMVKKLEEKEYRLVLVPWYRYLAWSKVEAFYGLTRTTGPTFAGYFSDQVLPYELGDQADHLRAILIDFANLTAAESSNFVYALMQESTRSGVRPLLENDTPVYCETWYQGQGLGLRLDAVVGLPEIAKTDWAKRGNAIRMCMTALWTLVYDEGPGKGELSAAISSKSAKAYFTVAADKSCLTLRLCYSMTSWTPKDALAYFWPDAKRPMSAAQVLLRFADAVRVHTVADTTDVEVVAVLFPSAPSQTSHLNFHTLWVEPIAAHTFIEVPFEGPSSKSPWLHALPNVPVSEAKQQQQSAQNQGGQAKDRFIFDAALKIREMKKELSEKDDMIRELRSGGVGTSQPLPPPDGEALLEGFQERYFELKFQIRQLEVQIAQAEQRRATPQELEALRLKINALIQREQAWIKRLAATIEKFRAAG